jgi:hypothetical protein
MTLTPPSWLTQRGGELHCGNDGRSCSVHFAGQLQYVLVPIPAKGQHACRITETINGRRLESGKTYPTVEQAFQGGLEDLRAKLGW